jgi:mono/diheme cytochrome c family protein
MKLYFMLAALLGLSLAVAQQPPKKPVVTEPQEPPAEWKVPPEDAKRENPVKPTEASIADGKKLFGYQCTMCHGEKGDGKGDLAEAMKLTMLDYNKPDALKDWTDGMLFYVIEKGKDKMPSQEGRMMDPQVWNLVNYIRSLAKKPNKEPEPKTKPE